MEKYDHSKIETTRSDSTKATSDKQAYDFKAIEIKWQKKWDEQSLDLGEDFSKKPKHYHLIEFPYPSGAGLHVGHCMGYGASDAYCRMKRMQGYNVMFPIGWDAFGLPTENFAIKNKTKPQDATAKNVANFIGQMKRLGLSFDWDREINTTDPDYYKWTQWIFLQFYKHGIDANGKLIEIADDDSTTPRLAYQAEMPINWCPSCKIGLANEEVIAGKCERCGAEVVKKMQKQWMMRITAYADRLIKDLDTVEYLDKIKTQQINWIGKSTGTNIKFKVVIPAKAGIQNKELDPRVKPEDDNNVIEVFTTRADTLFGCTYIVLAPEHPLLENLKFKIQNSKEVEKYQEEAKKKSDLERTELQKEKTGVKLEGIKAINPINNEEVDVYVADYVLASYGTGAVMAVPAHDDRDFEFAKKYGIEIKQVIVPEKILKQVQNDNNIAFTDYGFLINSGEFDGLTSKEGKKKITEKLKSVGAGDFSVNYKLRDWVFSRQHYWGEPIPILHCPYCAAKNPSIKKQSKLTINFYDQNIWQNIVNRNKTVETRALNPDESDRFFGNIKNGDFITAFNKNSQEELILKIKDVKTYKTLKELLEDKNTLKKVSPISFENLEELESSYDKLAPNYLEKIKSNGLVAWEFEIVEVSVPLDEKDLPLTLPDVEHYEPTNTGKSPLAAIDSWVNVTCPKCGRKAKRETDTMPNWAGSSWYFLRYCDPKNNEVLADKDNLNYWMPVDLYNGGMEHTTLHLLYSRFWNKFLYDLGVVPTSEPYQKRIAHGMILGPDGRKMSKSFGNVINPDDIIKQFGADTTRAYIMFVGPYDQESAWNMAGVQGVYRFLNRVFNNFKLADKNHQDSSELLVKINKIIQSITNDLNNFHLNTVVSKLMEANNAIEKEAGISQELYEKFIQLLLPVAPHLASELWEMIGKKERIDLSIWPVADKNYLTTERIEIVVQINGKVRDKIMVASDISDDDLKDIVLNSDKFKYNTEGKKIIKTIVVPKKLVSVVVK